MLRKLVPLIGTLLWLLAPGVYALGLGNIQLHSALDQPLEAEIELLSVRPGELESLSINLASGEDYRRAGIDRLTLLGQLEFDVARRADGTPYIAVTSRQPIREPFLNFLIEANWSSGRMLREYTLLLDPPTFLADGAAPQQAMPARTQAPAIERAPAATAPSPRATAASGPAVRSRAGGPLEYGPVRPDDTLWQIARELQPEAGVSLPQVMMALLRSNPEAFEGNNVNRLKKGYVLRIEDPSTLTAMTRQQAAQEFRRQTLEWEAFKRQLAERGPGAPSGAEPAAAGTPTGTLRLVSADGPSQQGSGAGQAEEGSGAVATLRNDLALAEEAAEAERRRNQELQARLEELDAQVDLLQRLISLRDDELATLQRQLRQEGQQPAAGEGGAEQTTRAAPAAVPEAGERGVAEGVDELLAAAMALRDQVLANPPMLGGVVAATLLLLILLLVRIRRRLNAGQYEESILTAGPVAAAASASGKPGAEQTSFLSDFAVSGMSDLPSDDGEVDPVAEAEVYMAYGRYEQAQELLNNAVSSDPDRQDLRLKLLELYHTTGNGAQFQDAAETFVSRFGEQDPAWPRVQALGGELCPQHPLFANAPKRDELGEEPMDLVSPALDDEVLDIGLDTGIFETEAALPGEADTGEFDLDLGGLDDFLSEDPKRAGGPAPTSGNADGNRGEPAGAADESALGLDFDLGEAAAESPSAAPAAASDEMTGLEFALEANEAVEAPAATSRAEEQERPSEDSGLEFDLDGMDFQTPEEPAATSDAAAEMPAMDFDLAPSAGDVAQEAPPAQVSDDGGLDFDELLNEPAATDPAALDEGAVVGDEDGVASDAATEPAPAAELQSHLADVAGERDYGPAAEAEFDADDFGLSDELDEVGTKLDLAQAYIHMGDTEGARNILEEVLAEGNDAQQQEAQGLMKQIA